MTSLKSASEKSYYPFLDGFRAVAVLWVISIHLRGFFHLETFTHPLIARICWLGFLGVDIFFVISGFLITGLLINDLDTSIRWKRFYLRRAFKILPQFFVVVIVGLIMTFLVKEDWSILRILSYVFMFQNYVAPIEPIGHLWTIAVEEHFYIVYPLLLLLACTLYSQQKTRRNFIIILLIVLLVVGNVLRFLHFTYFYTFDLYKLVQVTHVRFDALIFGCLIKLMEPHFIKIKDSKDGRILSWFYFLAGFFLYVSFIYRFEIAYWLYFTLAYIGAGCFLIAGLLNFRPLIYFTEYPLIRKIGKYSYGIYLWHYPLIFCFRIWYSMFNENKIIIFLYILSCIFVGALSTKTIERYFLNLREKVIP